MLSGISLFFACSLLTCFYYVLHCFNITTCDSCNCKRGGKRVISLTKHENDAHIYQSDIGKLQSHFWGWLEKKKDVDRFQMETFTLDMKSMVVIVREALKNYYNITPRRMQNKST